ncbi:hypothetical protein KAI92_01400 [Candidatus Parcubacteria bacterium]|nr:hypothetical protein [Candidatus Parcubacteria bacterium]
MITLNIISKVLKKNIKINKIYKSIKKILFILFINLSIYTIILLLMFALLQLKHSKVSTEAMTMNKDTEIYSIKAKKINQQINEISKIQNDFIPWSTFFNNFTNSVNSKITITNISVNKKDKLITIKGSAKTRTDLISFKNTIKEISYLEEIDLPMKNLLIKENINFNIETKFINYEFK